MEENEEEQDTEIFSVWESNFQTGLIIVQGDHFYIYSNVSNDAINKFHKMKPYLKQDNFSIPKIDQDKKYSHIVTEPSKVTYINIYKNQIGNIKMEVNMTSFSQDKKKRKSQFTLNQLRLVELYSMGKNCSISEKKSLTFNPKKILFMLKLTTSMTWS